MEDTPSIDPSLTSVLNLHKADSANQLIRASQAVIEYYGPAMAEREQNHDFVRGNHWTAEERAIAKQKKKALIEFNKLKTSERTFIGAMIQQRYDIKIAPREPTDQTKADVYSNMYHWQADTTDVKYKDPGIIRDAWAGGNGFQESYVEITPGRKPRICVVNQNPFAIYPDPNRRDLVNNTDCEFMDRISWMTVDALVEAFPDMEGEILSSLKDFQDISYQATKVYADRTHEWENFRNGRFKVIERFYKVRKKNWFGEKDGERIDVGQDADFETRNRFKDENPEHNMYYEREEFLYLAVAVPSMGGKFLFNDKYHNQPRDPVTDKIMFTFVELVDEDLDGDPAGHVAPQVGPIKVLNSLAVNTIFAVKNASGQSHTIDSDYYTEDVATDIEENLADGSRTFRKKPGAGPGTGITLVEQGGAPRDNNSLMAFVTAFTEEVSSTPPNMKGEVVSSESGVLNEQRIQQSAIQSQVFTNNFMNFLTRRAKLWKYYWKEYFTAQDVIRVLEKKDEQDPDFMEINKVVEDEFGNPAMKNTLDDGDAYDIAFEDSYKSPTARSKILQQITQLQQNGAAANDPEMGAFLNYTFLSLSDVPQDIKAKAKAFYEKRQQAAEQPPAPKPPDPIRLSMSIAGPDLHDPAVIALLEANQAITPEVAQQISAAPPLPPSPDAIAQAHKAHADIAKTKMDTHSKHINNLQQVGILPPASPVSPGTPPSSQRPEPSMAGA